MATATVDPRTPQPLLTRDAFELPTHEGRPVLGRSSRADAYPIYVTRTMPEALLRLRDLIGDARVALVTDATVHDLLGPTFLGGLKELGIEPHVAVVPAGEVHKSLDQAVRLWHWLAISPLGRRDVVLTFGGGVVNDMAGWVAAGYMRGMRYINVPTTLVGQVDAGIGGKLAVNHGEAKNLIGGFHQPTGVVSNVSFLETLDMRHICAGLAESIKKALIASPAYWQFIEGHAEAILAKDMDALEQLVRAAAAIKTALIERDPYEHDSRRTLGFGHALAHPLETVTGYGPILHGEAVAFGMVVECRMAATRGLLDEGTLGRIVALLRRVRLPTCASELPIAIDGDTLLGATEKVRLARGGYLRWVLPLGLGETVIADDVTDRELREALRWCGVEVE
ncbi:MAG TPA: 3-dehydroquinate synthase family protein [Solirubrobacteraceae bacterium]